MAFFRAFAINGSPKLSILGLCLAITSAFAASNDGPLTPGYPCLIEPYQKIELRSPVEGAIARILVDRGSRVKKGQLLVELDVAAERAALDAAHYRAVMDGQIKGAETKLAAAREKFERRDQLSKEQFIAMQDRDDALTELEVASASLIEAQDNRRLAMLEQKRLSETIEQKRLRSPLDGVVTERLQQVGEVTQTGESARAILRLAQIDPLRVEVVLSVTMLGHVASGAMADVLLEPPLTGRYQAAITIVDRLVDSASGTFGVRLRLANPKGDVPTGVKCKVYFNKT